MGAIITLTTDFGLADACVAAMIRSTDLPEPAIAIEAGNQSIPGLSRTYAEGRGLLALIGSSDYQEVALEGGSASAFLGAEVGSEVKIRTGNQ